MRQLFLFLSTFAIVLNVGSQTPIKLSNDQLHFIEGPLWDGLEFIYFTEIKKSKVWKYSVKTNVFTIAFENTNMGNGLAFNKKHEMLICEGSKGRITKRDIQGNLLKVVASEFKGKRFNTTNDMCLDKKGGIYFTDPSWGELIQPDNAIYYLSSKGNISKLDSFGDGKPNGIIISPNGEKLYVNDSYDTTIYRYDINKDTGKVSSKIHFATITNEGGKKETGADGMAVDVEGNLYITADKTLQIFNTSGEAIKTIHFPEKTTNCTFGGIDKKTLFVTAATNLYSVDIGIKGVTHPFDLP